MALRNVLACPNIACRICLCEATSQISLLSTCDDDNRTVCELLSFLVNIKISISNTHPQQICSECFSILKKAVHLKERCILSENILREAHQELEKSTELESTIQYKFPMYPKIFSYQTISEYSCLDPNIDKISMNKYDSKEVIQTEILDLPKTEVDVVIKNELNEPDFNKSVSPEKNRELIEEFNNSSSLENDIIACDCLLTFTSEGEHKRHAEQCKKAKIFVYNKNYTLFCKKCIIKLPDLKSFSEHMKQHKVKSKKPQGNKGLYKCNKCMRKFTYKSSLHTHMLKHEEDQQQKFICKSCKREFKHQAHLDNHILLVHTRDRGYSCECCDKNFTTLEALHVHKEVHKVEKKHQCHICNKSFIMMSSLTDHLRTHTGEKPFLCSTCGKGFSQKTNLEQHIRRHLGLKPFQCENCDKR